MLRLTKRQVIFWLAGQVFHWLVVFAPTIVMSMLHGLSLGATGSMLIFVVAVTCACMVESYLVMRNCQGHEAVRDEGIRDPLALRMSMLVGLLLLVHWWLAQCEYHWSVWHQNWLMAIGAVAVASGITLRALAIAALGPAFQSDIRLDGEVIRTGVYKWLRHPSEIGLCLIAVGAPMILSATWTMSFAAILFPSFSIWRSVRENRFLTNRPVAVRS